jgi:hypothetical protein
LCRGPTRAEAPESGAEWSLGRKGAWGGREPGGGREHGAEGTRSIMMGRYQGRLGRKELGAERRMGRKGKCQWGGREAWAQEPGADGSLGWTRYRRGFQPEPALAPNLHPNRFQYGKFNFMRPKRTFSRSERVRVVPPEGESPPQAPPGACPPHAFAGEFALTGVRGTRFGSFPGPSGALLTVRGQSSRARPAWARGTQPSLRASTRGGREGPLSVCGTGTLRGEQEKLLFLKSL